MALQARKLNSCCSWHISGWVPGRTGLGGGGRGLKTRRNNRLIFVNLGLTLITLFNKWPITPALLLYPLDLSLTVLCPGACGFGVLLAVQSDKEWPQRVLRTMHCSRRLWIGRTRKDGEWQGVASFQLTAYVTAKWTPELVWFDELQDAAGVLGSCYMSWDFYLEFLVVGQED